ncbi:MAG: hypothetical protein PHW83_12530, partial [Bacteroidales bacterium]|nr:hypothetical protein [Bacteroidales bacterium]
YSVYHFRKLQIKDQIESERKLGRSEQSFIKFELTREQTNRNLTWLSKREFKYAEIIYRIDKVKYIGDKIIYYCHVNSESLEIHNNLDKLVNVAMGHNTDQQSTDNLLNFMKSLFSSKYDENICLHQSWLIHKNIFYNDKLFIRYVDIADPPPKFTNC